jgi:hypothetical protein
MTAAVGRGPSLPRGAAALTWKGRTGNLTTQQAGPRKLDGVKVTSTIARFPATGAGHSSPSG